MEDRYCSTHESEMMKREKIYIVDDIKEVNFCGHKILNLTGGEYELPFSIKPTTGDHSYETCNGCYLQRGKIIEDLKTQSKSFPFCCDSHSKLVDFSEFKVENYQGLEEQVADKVMFCHQHIINRLDTEEWYEDITDYLQYVFESFGSFPPKYGSPFMISQYYAYLDHLINMCYDSLGSDKIPKKELNNRLKKVHQFLRANFVKNGDRKKETKRDLNLLLTTYDKWFKTFPFELDYFKHLKTRFQTRIPVLDGKVRTNRYTGVSTAKLLTKDDLIIYLLSVTKQIISSINGQSLFSIGKLSDVEKLKLDLIVENRKVELEEIAIMDNSDRKSYIKVLKKWFRSEKKFIQEITPFLEGVPPASEEMSELTIRQIALKLAYEGIIVTKENGDELIKEYGHKSGLSLYNKFLYYSLAANRKGNPSPFTKTRFRNKISRFEKVIDHLSGKARSRALDELNVLKENYKIEFE